MFLRIDRLQVELAQPTKADPNSAAALPELLGGKFGEMSTLNKRSAPVGATANARCRLNPPCELELVDGHPDGGKIPDLAGISAAFNPNYEPEEIFEIACKPYKAAKS